MDDLIIKAAQLAKRAHEGQLRKYRPRPYILHPARVAARTTLLPGVTAQEIAAAWLHDVIEDTPYTAGTLRHEGIPDGTMQMVQELTNPSKQHPDFPRAERKRLDLEHLHSVSYESKCIKLIDRTDNLRDMQGAKPDFCSLYAAESVLLAECLAGTSAELEEELLAAIEELGFPRCHQDSRTQPSPA